MARTRKNHPPSLKAKVAVGAIYPKPHLSRPAPGHESYPYLLRGVGSTRANQVWSTGIPYIPRRGGFLYLVAVMAWFSSGNATSGRPWTATSASTTNSVLIRRSGSIPGEPYPPLSRLTVSSHPPTCVILLADAARSSS